MYESVNANFGDMGRNRNAGHLICMIFFNVTWQTVDVRKARKIVMKSEIVLNTTNKTHIKNVRIFDMTQKFSIFFNPYFCISNMYQNK